MRPMGHMGRIRHISRISHIKSHMSHQIYSSFAITLLSSSVNCARTRSPVAMTWS